VPVESYSLNYVVAISVKAEDTESLVQELGAVAPYRCFVNVQALPFAGLEAKLASTDLSSDLLAPELN
jgi:hypothetical protein